MTDLRAMIPKDAGRIAIASSYGLPGREVERAFERGVGFFFWGALRRRDFGAALRRIARAHRERLVLAVQTYTRKAVLVRPSVEIARRRLGVDTIDLLGLGYWNVPPPAPLLDAAVRLRERGVVRSLVVSCHDRRTLATLIADPAYDGVMIRYNAAHVGAADAVLPLAHARGRPVLAYTATRWGTLASPDAAPPGERAPTAADCYRFVLAHPAVRACLAGPKDAGELDVALDALDAPPMTPEELAWMRRAGERVRARGHVRARARARLAPSPAAAWKHAKAIAHELRERGITEELLSRFVR